MWRAVAGGASSPQGEEAELSLSGSGERVIVSRRSSRAESWVGSLVASFMVGSHSMDRSVEMRAANLGEGGLLCLE